MNHIRGTSFHKQTPSKRVVLTGAGGFVGSHILEELMDKTDWFVICVDSFKHRGRRDRIYDLDISFDRFTVVEIDLAKPISAVDRLKFGGVDYIINCASESHVDRSIDDPVPFVENNIMLMLQMLELARAIKPKVFVQVSTDEVYGPAPEGVSFIEDDELAPANPYSASKVAQEALCLSYSNTYGVPIIITRTMNMIGQRQDVEKFVPKCIDYITNGKSLPIHEGGSRSYLHARNYANAVRFLIDVYEGWAKVVNPSPFVVNVAGEKEVGNLEMAEMIAGIVGKELIWHGDNESRPGHDLRYAIDDSALRKGLEWVAPVSFEDGLKTTVEWTILKENEKWLK